MYVHIYTPPCCLLLPYRLTDSQHDSVSGGASPFPPRVVPSKSSEENNSSGKEVIEVSCTWMHVCMYVYIYMYI